MINYIDVILYLRPTAKVALIGGETYAHIVWEAGEIPISEVELNANWATVQAAKDAEVVQKTTQDQLDNDTKTQVKNDTFVQSFIDMTPNDVTAYINANVTDLVSAKNVINKLALMVLLLAKKEYR